MSAVSRWMALLALVLVAIPSGALAQSGSVTGMVADATTGRPLTDAQVSLPALERGVLTNARGRYLLTGLPPGAHEVSVTRIGYTTQTQQVMVGPAETVVADFRLEEGAIGLDEIVVTGYQVSEVRADRTGATTGLLASEIELLPINTTEQVLQGLTAGVQVGATTGQPGSGLEVRVRGIGSIDASNQPLYIVDGVQIAADRAEDVDSYVSTSPLSSINPRDIESIQVLKDAAATSIYGAQAANGVVLITTKRGIEGPTEWTFTTEFGQARSLDTWDVVGGPEWVELQMEAYANRSEDTGGTRVDGEAGAIAAFGSPSEVGTYDWQSEVLRTGQLRNFSASTRGGSENTRFYISGAFNRQEGQLVKSSFDRMTFRANLDHRATERLSIVANVGLSNADQEGDIDGNCQNCAFWAAPFMRPTLPIYNEDGSFNQAIAPIPYNIAFQVYNEDRLATTRQALGTVTGNYAITPRLNFRSLWGLDYRTRRETNYRPPEQQVIGNSGIEIYREITNWNTNQVLNYSTTLARSHDITVLAGAEYREELYETFSAQGTGFPSGLFRTLDLAAVPQGIGGSTGGFKLGSFFSRVQYGFEDRYLLSASVRRDGSSRFGSDFRWGTFYSASAGWNVIRESFMEDVTFLSDLSLRVSYGITGNSAIDDFASLTLFGQGVPGVTGLTGNSYLGQAGLRPTQLGNDELTWEEARTVNVGLSWEALNGRLYGAFDAFRTNNENLLLEAFLPIDAGFDAVTQNVGTVRNQGLELELGAIPIQGSFTWRSDFNISKVENKILELVGGLENIGDDIRVGYPVEIHWGARWAGVNPADGRPMWYDAAGNPTYRVTAADEQVLGSPLPDYEGGWRNSLSYQGVRLDVFLQFALGQDVQDSQLDNLLDVASTRGLWTGIRDRWQQPGDVTDIPRLYTNSAQPGTSSWTTFSDRFLYDGSYVRLKSTTLSYDLPPDVAQRIRLNGARIYVQGQNLWTKTEFLGIDPEVQGASGNTYPNSRQILFGLTVRP